MTSFYPSVGSRATNQLSITRLLFQINSDQTSIQDLQTQISTGRRITRPSQDPAAAIKGLAAQRHLEFKSQVDENLKSADSLLSATESSLSQAQAIINDMRGIVVLAADTSLSTEEKQAFIAQIDAAIERLTQIGNTKFRDQFLFGGSNVQNAPFSYINDTIRFNGNHEQLNTITDFAATISANVSAEDAFGVRSDRVVGISNLDPAVHGGTPLSQLNRGDGVRGGSISFSDGAIATEVDLSNAYDLNDVLETINSSFVGSRALSASLTSNGINIEYADGLGGVMRVAEVGRGLTASGLGIRNVGAVEVSPVIGTDLDPIATVGTSLTDLFGGAGIASGSSFQIVQGGRTFIVETDGAITIEDLIHRVNESGAKVEAGLDPSGRFLAIRSTESGSAMSIGENGNDLATVLGIRTFSTTTQLSALNFGQGISLSETGDDDLAFTRTDGSELLINLNGALTIGDVIDRINNHADNLAPPLIITASLSSTGNGIVLSSPTGAQEISVKNVGGSQAGWGLGLIPGGAAQATGATLGTDSVLGSSDVSGLEVESIFTSLIRMRQAIQNDRPEDMVRISASLDEDVQRISLARGLVGTRQQAIAQTSQLSEEQQLHLKEIESLQLDANLAEVISELTSRQAALQASLSLVGKTSQLSLFNYL